MPCKYKKYNGTDGIHPWCWVTGGECQFLKSPWDEQCEILNAYPKKPLDIKEYDVITITDITTTDILNLIIEKD